MGSSSKEKTSTKSQNVVVDRRTALEQGQQIVDSIVTDNSAEVIDVALQSTLAAWDSMTASNNLNLIEVAQMGNTLLQMVDKSQLKMSDTAVTMLRDGVAMFEEILAQNQLTVSLVEGVSDRAFDQSGQALDLIAEVKTADFADLSKTIMLFALAALAITSFTVRSAK